MVWQSPGTVEAPLSWLLILWPVPDGGRRVSPGAGVQAGRRPPRRGVGLDAGEDGTTLVGSGAGHGQAPSS